MRHHQWTAFSLQPHWLHWHEWTRYSSRQNILMQFGGLIGEVDLDGPALLAFWLGQWTHVGKGAAFGLGGYRLLASPENPDAPPQACDPWSERQSARH